MRNLIAIARRGSSRKLSPCIMARNYLRPRGVTCLVPYIRLIKNEKDVLHYTTPLACLSFGKRYRPFSYQTINPTYFPFLLYLIVIYVNRHSFSIFVETLELIFFFFFFFITSMIKFYLTILKKIITQSVNLYLFF